MKSDKTFCNFLESMQSLIDRMYKEMNFQCDETDKESKSVIAYYVGLLKYACEQERKMRHER